MSNLLVIDDEPGIRAVLKDVLEDEGYQISLAEDGFEGLEILKKKPIDLVILDVWLPNMGGIDVLKKIKEDFAEIEVIIISGHANISLAVQAVKLGAFDFLEKPLSLDKTTTVVRNALRFSELKHENRSLKNSIFIEDEMIGQSTPMERVKALIRQSAASDSRILILGENGTGKELVARQIHMKSHRVSRPFVEVNCAAIPENLIESELFGHEKGAFTSAVGRRKGKFELADKGTLFLDEIADMTLHTQAKVLRAIQEQTFERIGGEETLSVDIRVIAATNKNIEEEINAGRFREDLYFRINVIPIVVPPLRERSGDMTLLVDYFMRRFKNPAKAQPKTLSSKAMAELEKYAWPGNIRELKNFVERVNIMVSEDVIDLDHVVTNLGKASFEIQKNIPDEYARLNLNEAKNQFEKNFIVDKLEDNEYNISRTAEKLGIYASNLHSNLKKYQIEIERR